jgi:hypothetical protein
MPIKKQSVSVKKQPVPSKKPPKAAIRYGKSEYTSTDVNAFNIFVFGSNLIGFHGAGAARAALDFGAIMGKGIGHHGNTYAIPTKDGHIHTLPINDVLTHVRKFIQYANEHPELNFLVTRIGCGLAGFTDAQIAPMFQGVPQNCVMPAEWKAYLEAI